MDKKRNLRSGNVGTELQKSIPDVFEKKGCGCKSLAEKMNAWGVEGCKQRRDDIIDYLVEKASKDKFARFLPRVITRAVAARWVDDSINTAEQNLKEESPETEIE